MNVSMAMGSRDTVAWAMTVKPFSSLLAWYPYIPSPPPQWIPMLVYEVDAGDYRGVFIGCQPAVDYRDNPYQPGPVSRLAHSGPPGVYSGHEGGGYMKDDGCPHAGDPESEIWEPGQLCLRVSRTCVLWQEG